MTGYIYKIVNDLNEKVYVGQTLRSLDIRFDEHCYDRRSSSKIHKAISELGVSHFKIIEIEHYDNLESLDPLFLNERETYWVTQFDSFNSGYNGTASGQYADNYDACRPEYFQVKVEESNLIFDSKEQMARIINKFTSWKDGYTKDLIGRSISEQKPFLNTYHLSQVKSIQSPLEDLEEWARGLKVYYCCKNVHLVELDLTFDSHSEAAVYLIKHGLYEKESKAPFQQLITQINRGIKSSCPVKICGDVYYTFEELPTTTKTNINANNEHIRLYCPQLKTIFPSRKSFITFIEREHLWGNVCGKTIETRVFDLLKGYFQDYRGYQVFKVDDNDNPIEPELYSLLKDKVLQNDCNWIADESIIEKAQKFAQEQDQQIQQQKEKLKQKKPNYNNSKHGVWETYKDLVDLYLKLGSVEQVSKQYHTAKVTIYKALKEYNIKIKTNEEWTTPISKKVYLQLETGECIDYTSKSKAVKDLNITFGMLDNRLTHSTSFQTKYGIGKLYYKEN